MNRDSDLLTLGVNVLVKCTGNHSLRYVIQAHSCSFDPITKHSSGLYLKLKVSLQSPWLVAGY